MRNGDFLTRTGLLYPHRPCDWQLSNTRDKSTHDTFLPVFAFICAAFSDNHFSASCDAHDRESDGQTEDPGRAAPRSTDPLSRIRLHFSPNKTVTYSTPRRGTDRTRTPQSISNNNHTVIEVAEPAKLEN